MGEAALVRMGLNVALLDACAAHILTWLHTLFFFSGDKEMKSTQLRLILFRGKEWKVRWSDTQSWSSQGCCAGRWMGSGGQARCPALSWVRGCGGQKAEATSATSLFPKIKHPPEVICWVTLFRYWRDLWACSGRLWKVYLFVPWGFPYNYWKGVSLSFSLSQTVAHRC